MRPDAQVAQEQLFPALQVGLVVGELGGVLLDLHHRRQGRIIPRCGQVEANLFRPSGQGDDAPRVELEPAPGQIVVAADHPGRPCKGGVRGGAVDMRIDGQFEIETASAHEDAPGCSQVDIQGHREGVCPGVLPAHHRTGLGRLVDLGDVHGGDACGSGRIGGDLGAVDDEGAGQLNPARGVAVDRRLSRGADLADVVIQQAEALKV